MRLAKVPPSVTSRPTATKHAPRRRKGDDQEHATTEVGGGGLAKTNNNNNDDNNDNNNDNKCKLVLMVIILVLISTPLVINTTISIWYNVNANSTDNINNAATSWSRSAVPFPRSPLAAAATQPGARGFQAHF